MGFEPQIRSIIEGGRSRPKHPVIGLWASFLAFGVKPQMQSAVACPPQLSVWMMPRVSSEVDCQATACLSLGMSLGAVPYGASIFDLAWKPRGEEGRQTMMFSATFPREMQAFCHTARPVRRVCELEIVGG